MAGSQIKIEMKEFAQAANGINAMGPNADQIYMAVAGLVESQTRRRIATEKSSPDGTKWPAWSTAYKASRKKGKSLLMASGELLDSIASAFTGTTVEVGSNLEYAAVHQHGGLDSMSAGPAAIPARPFLGLSPENADELLELVTGMITGDRR